MINPRPYISWSSLNLWESNPERWIQVYLYGEKIPINRGMATGKKLAEGLETGELTGDEAMDMTMLKIPKLEVMEMKLEATLEIGGEKIPLLGYADTAKKDLSAFFEYKTSQTPWTQAKVDGWGQLTFYATIIWLKTKKIPKDIQLVDIRTKMQLDGNLRATGAVKCFTTRREILDILKMQVRIKKAWKEIKERVDKELF